MTAGRRLALGLAMLLPVLGPSTGTVQALDYGRNPAPLLELETYRSGRSSAHRLSFSVFRGELETYRVRVAYPAGFRFRGFDALGPVNTPVGTLGMDAGGDGRADVTLTLRSLGPGAAYADVIADGRFTPGLEPLLTHNGRTGFLLRLPFGGDANPDTLVAPFDSRVTLTLFDGLLTNPDRGGTYTITAELVSVDPDTDGADNGAGAPPLTVAFDVAVPIEHVPFARLCVDKADLKRHGIKDHETGEDDDGEPALAVRDRFRVRGRFALGAGSDGLDLSLERVTVTLGGVALAIPGRLLGSTGHAVEFRDRRPGIRALELRGDGTFDVDVRGVDLGGIDLGRPVAFSLQVGDDRGEALILFDRNGHLRPNRPGPGCAP